MLPGFISRLLLILLLLWARQSDAAQPVQAVIDESRMVAGSLTSVAPGPDGATSAYLG